MNVQPLFKLMVEKNASDLFLTCFAPVKIKIDGKIRPINKLDLTPKMIRQAAMELMTEEQMDELARELEIAAALRRIGGAGEPGRLRRALGHRPLDEGVGLVDGLAFVEHRGRA